MPAFSLILLLLVALPASGQMNPGLNPDRPSASVFFSTTNLPGGANYRTVGGDVMLPPVLLPRGTAFRVGGEIGFFGGPGTAGSPRPAHFDGILMWELGDRLFPELPLGLLVSTGGELFYFSEAGSSLRRIDVPLRAGLHYSIPLIGGMEAIPGVALTAAYVTERVSVPGEILTDSGSHLHLEFGASLQLRARTALHGSVRLGDERFGDRTRIQLGVRSGL